jgi:hypothetical protein
LSDVSKQAWKREGEVKALFHQAVKEARTAVASLPKGEKYLMEDYVPPKYHLTAYTWKTFRPWVEEHSGWKAKRRVASEKELVEYQQERKGNHCPSRGKSYYISFIYQDPSTIKKRNKKKAAGGDVEEEHQEPPAKKSKAGPLPSNYGSVNLGSLPEQMQLHILSYCDVPTLGAVVPVCKNLCRLAKNDRLWEPHLRYLLRELFDSSLRFMEHPWRGRRGLAVDPATPLSQREDWRQSTALLRWFQEPREGLGHKEIHKVTAKFLQAAVQYYNRRRVEPQRRQAQRSCRQAPRRDVMHERFAFLMKDVPLREYFHRVGNLAFRSTQREDLTTDEEHNKFCPECFSKAGTKPSEFANLPNIMWCV